MRPSGPGSVSIRPEVDQDVPAIREVVRAAFSSRLEADLVDRLRQDGLAIRSLVAVDESGLVGHVMFSPVRVVGEEPGRLASLAPVAVRPDRQRCGIGAALIEYGIEECRDAGWPAIIVVGEPTYYQRFGFRRSIVAHFASPYAGDAFLGLELVPGAITRLRGTVEYPAAFAMLS